MTTENATNLTSEKEVKPYELGIIVPSNLSESEVKAALERTKKEIAHVGGKISEVQEWGKRKLAYKIAGHEMGYYFFIYFDMPGGKGAQELDNFCRIDRDIIRHLLIALEKNAKIVDYSKATTAYGRKPAYLQDEEEVLEEDEEIVITDKKGKVKEIDKVSVKEVVNTKTKEVEAVEVIEEKVKFDAKGEAKEVEVVAERAEKAEKSNKLDKILDDLDSDIL